MRKIVVGISHGDINGISYEIILKTLNDNRLCEFCTPVLFGSTDVLNHYKKLLDLQKFTYQITKDINHLSEQKVNLVHCTAPFLKVEMGQSTKAAGEAAFAALEMAVNELQQGTIDVLVTAPINKENIQSDEFHFKGHTEYLQEKDGKDKSLMFMVSDFLKVGLVSNHVAIEDVKAYITTERIEEQLNLMRESLIYDFGIQKPKIAILALNPHAGDGGVIGKEENEIITPLIEKKKSEGHLVYGPFPSDGFFATANYQKYDAILAMYHDQGLIPFKMLAADNGVNFTAGLNFVRTSPSHGTAYDIAGQNKASEESFRNAIYAAIDVFRNRINYNEANANPLKKGIANTNHKNRGRQNQPIQ